MKRKKSPGHHEPKRGVAYQRAVAAIVQPLFPDAEVTATGWIVGPDGERDCDVVVRAKRDGAVLAVIECKDARRPVGKSEMAEGNARG